MRSFLLTILLPLDTLSWSEAPQQGGVAGLNLDARIIFSLGKKLPRFFLLLLPFFFATARSLLAGYATTTTTTTTVAGQGLNKKMGPQLKG